MIEEVVSGIFHNLGVIFFIVGLIVAIVKLRRAHRAHVVATASYVFFGELVFWAVGITFLYVATMHAFFQGIAAPSIGWRPSPFEWELAFAEYGIAVIALMSLWRGYEFRLAGAIVFGIFAFGAAGQHINQMLCCANYHPGNAGVILWFGDLFVPILLFVLAYASRDAYEKSMRR